MPQIDNEVAKVQEMLKTEGIVETLANDVEILDERTTRQEEEITTVQDTVDSIVSGNIAAGKANQDKEGNVIHETYFQGGMKTFASDVELNNSVSKGIYHSSSLGLIVCFFESDTVTPAYQLWFKPDRQEPLIRYWDDLDKTYNFWMPYFAVDLLTEQEFDAIQSEWDGGTYWVGEPLDYYVAWIYPNSFNLCRMRIKNGILEESTLNGTEWTPWRNKNNNAPLILSLKQDIITKKYQIVNSNGEQVLFDEIYTEAQNRPVYCHAKDGQSLLPLSVLESSMIMFIGMPYGAGQTDYCEIQYDGEYGIISVHQRPLIVPEMSDSLVEETYLGSAPSLQYLEQYVRNNSSSKIEEIHINEYPFTSIQNSSALDTIWGSDFANFYKLKVYDNNDPDTVAYGWLFVQYANDGEFAWGQTLIDLNGEILSRHMNSSEWTEWKPISNGGASITVDKETDTFSENPIANFAITRYVDLLNAKIIGGEEIVGRAQCDAEGNDIVNTYVTLQALQADWDSITGIIGETNSKIDKTNSRIDETIDKIEAGEIIAGKAGYDVLDNMIHTTYATKEEVATEVGDISTALDAIIAIDNKLLGVSE